MSLHGSGLTFVSALSTPTVERDSPFEFPSFPSARLAEFGRKISQHVGDALAIDDAPPQTVKRPVPVRAHTHDHVPGMGDEPVLCPFCEKPLPPALFTKLGYSPVRGLARSQVPGSPTGLNTTTMIGSPTSPVATFKSLHQSALALDDKTSKTSAFNQPEPELPPANASATTTVDPSVTAESLQDSVRDAEKADTTAANSLISDDDLRRWSKLAGVTIEPTIAAVSPVAAAAPAPAPSSVMTADTAKPFPLLPPPPPPAKAPTSRFGFFGRRSSKEDTADEDSDDDDMGASGYARLTGPVSDDDDDNVHDKPRKQHEKKSATPFEKEVKQESQNNKEVDTHESPMAKPATPKIEEPTILTGESIVTEASNESQDSINEKNDDAELRAILREILGRVDALSKSHSELFTSHATLLTSLKIARSNIVMAEANAEMLEEQLRRAKNTAPSPAPVPIPSSRPGTPTSVRNSTEVARPSSDRVRPTSLQIPSQALASSGPSSATDPNKGVFGFWNGGKKKLPAGLGSVTIPSPAQMVAALPSPKISAENRQSFFDGISGMSGVAPYGLADPPQRPGVARSTTAAPRTSIESPGLVRSQSQVVLPTLSSTAAPRTSSLRDDGVNRSTIPSHSSELFKLRQAYAASQAKLESQAKEVEALKSGKKEIEAELESLSQALFEEANKMVADERRKRAELEDSLREVRDEREALRQTVQVLGGKIGKTPPSENEEENEDEKEVVEEETFEPRDLDKHYEALRKSIHHVAEGAEEEEREEYAESTTLLPTASEPVPVIPVNDTEPIRPIPTESLLPTETPTNVLLEPIEVPLEIEPNPWVSSPSVNATNPSVDPPAISLSSEADSAGEGELPVPPAETVAEAVVVAD